MPNIIHFPIRAFTSDSHRGLSAALVSVDLKRRDINEDMGRKSVREFNRVRILLCLGTWRKRYELGVRWGKVRSEMRNGEAEAVTIRQDLVSSHPV
jgi:hypothetical protein